MVDLCDKGSESDDMNSQSSQQSQTTTPDRGSSEGPRVKTCADCGTTKTPLWRGGPAGPKSLCNACGIRSRKKRRALLGLNKEEKKTKKTAGTKNVSHHHNNRSNNNSNSNNKGYESTSSTADSTNKHGDTLKRKLFTFGRDVALQRPRSSTTQRRKLGEEEQAAFLLMALSCGSVYA